MKKQLIKDHSRQQLYNQLAAILPHYTNQFTIPFTR